MNTLTDNLRQVRDRIANACATVGRSPDDVTIVAVTKRHPVALWNDTVHAGLLDLGENRVQEALAKLPHLPTGARLHLIGQLQTNKVNKAVGAFASIQTVDRHELLARVAKRAEQIGTMQDVWIQVNVTGEEQKGGCDPDVTAELWQAAHESSALRAIGLMTMARHGDDERATRTSFATLRELAGSLPPDGEPVALSMGMSGDFEWAVKEGSTHVRLGTTLFGPRPAA